MKMKGLFSRKSLDETNEEHSDLAAGHITLNRVLDVKDLTAFGVAAIIGAGVFSTIGRACYHGGPAVSLLFVFTAITCTFCALCYAEFASRVPVSGSAYTYAYVAFGELVAWIIGWNLILEYAISNITVAISWSAYVTTFLGNMGIHIPGFISTNYFAARAGQEKYLELISLPDIPQNIPESIQELHLIWESAPRILGSIPVIFNLPAFIGVVLITILVYVGIQESRNSAVSMVIFKLIVIVLVILVGVFYVKTENWVPFAPNGLAGVMQGVSAVFFAYVGFDAVSTAAEECKNPQRDLPLGMIYSLAICTVLYIAVSIILTGMVNYTELNVVDFLTTVFTKVGLHWFSGLLALSAIVATTSVLLVFQLAQPRIWMVMSRDGLLPKKFSNIHPKFKTPSFATIVMGFIVAVPSLFMNIELATDLMSIGTLFAFAAVCAGILFLPKNSHPGRFTVPYVNGKYIVPVTSILSLMAIVYFNPNFFPEFFAHADLAQHVFFVAVILISIFTYKKNYSLIPILGLISCLYLMTGLGIANWVRFAVWMFVGFLIYAFYGYKHSKMRN